MNVKQKRDEEALWKQEMNFSGWKIRCSHCCDAFPQTRNRTRLGFQTRKPYYTSTMIELPRSQIFVHNILALEVLHPTSNLSHDVEESVYRDAASVSALILSISG